MSQQDKIKLYNKLRPKSGVISQDDFKCIFCFELPGKGNNTGIVLCPHCRYPAHLDEFSEWTLASNLCSRCGTEISRSYRTKPKVISAKNYIAAMNYLLKHRKNK